jgi:hypothetical protein
MPRYRHGDSQYAYNDQSDCRKVLHANVRIPVSKVALAYLPKCGPTRPIAQRVNEAANRRMSPAREPEGDCGSTIAVSHNCHLPL